MDQMIFPQADDFNKIIKIMTFGEEQLSNSNYISESLKITQRQVSYYLSACKYLKLIENSHFTDLAHEIRRMDLKSQTKTYVKLILSIDIMFDAFYDYIFCNQLIKKDEIALKLYIKNIVVSESVAVRRASTVKKWIDWVIKQIERTGT